jgi:quercetin dioxygenase-like cupin family protein
MNVKELELVEGWSNADSTMRVRFNFPLQAAAGTNTTAVVYFEIEPGDHLGRHTDSAEEILYVVEGTGEAVVGDERVALEPGSLGVVPELVPHAVYNTSEATLKVVGFFSAAELEHVFDEPIQPLGTRYVHTPMAEVPA